VRPSKVIALCLYPQDSNQWLEARFNVHYLSVYPKDH